MATYPFLKIGDEGDDVRLLQRKLNDESFQLTVDGDFGGKTDTAVRAFQEREDLVVDGLVGDGTWGALLEQADSDAVFTVDHQSWRAALTQEQNAQSWVAPEQERIIRLIPEGASVGQKVAVTWFVGLFGMSEPAGNNLGPSLTPAFIEPYKAYWGIKNTGGLPWCAMAAWAAFMEGQGHDYRDKANWKQFCVLGNWWGSAYDTWRIAVKQRVWVPREELAKLSSSQICAAILVKNTRDGSDAAPSSSSGRWPGHVDLGVSWISEGSRLQAVGGNLGNTAKPSNQKLSAYIGGLLFPLAS